MRESGEDNRASADMTPTLIARLRNGEPDAAAMLERIYRKSLMRFCAGYLGASEDVQDAVQEIFWRVLKSEQVPTDFRAWLYKIARNHCLDVLRTRGRKRDAHELPGDSQLDGDLTGNLTKLIRREQRAHLRRLLAALPVNQREVLRLRYAENLSRAEIAHVLGVPESVVKSRLYEGLERLRKHTSLVSDG